ncbi:MAG: hypothetical protein ACFNTU_05145, partial [Catonella sp.]
MVKRVFAFIIAASIVITACGHKAHTDESGSVHTSSGKSLNDSELPGSDIVNTIIKVPDKEGNSKNISIKQKKRLKKLSFSKSGGTTSSALSMRSYKRNT